MTKLRDWLTDSRRTAIQAFLATLGILAVQAGLATEHQTGLILVMTGALLQLLQGLLALAFLRPSEAAVWFDTVGRGLIYAFAAAAAPVAVAVGLLPGVTSAGILPAVSSALTAFSALLAVLNAREPVVVQTTFVSGPNPDDILAAHAVLDDDEKQTDEQAAVARVQLRRDQL